MNNKYKILLVEDDDNIRIMVTAMLESAGYQVIEGRSCIVNELGVGYRICID